MRVLNLSTTLSAFDDVSVVAILIGLYWHCLNFQFPDAIWCWTSFHMLICHLCIFFGKVSVYIFAHFQLCCFFPYFVFSAFFVYLDLSPLSDMMVQIFFPVCGLCFHSLNGAFCRAEVFKLLKSRSSIYFYMDFVVSSNNNSTPNSRSPRFFQ